MSQRFDSYRGPAIVRRLSGCLAVLAVLLLTLVVVPGAQAQTHVSNPFVGAKVYLNPDYTTEVNGAVAAEPAGSTLAEQMNTVASYPTAVWLDRIAAIQGGGVNSGRLSLQGHISAAVAQAGGSPIVVELVIYDLPDRDCAALASNGELSIAGNDTPKGLTTPLTGSGISEYEHSYIDPIATVLAAAPSNVRFVLVIEDDSLPNIITNTGIGGAAPIANCVAANNGQTFSQGLSMQGVYVQGIQYALNKFHALPNAYNYLDVGHHGWLGWTANMTAAVPFFVQVAKGTTSGVASVDGFITNTANYGATKEPFMTATQTIGGQPVDSSAFFQFDPEIDEEDYAAAFDSNLISAGFASSLGFLIDTSRNGWGGPGRPAAASTSTDLNTFVDASKIDLRDDMGQWCNQENSGLGVPPTVNPGFFANLQAYVWIKPPGESDGNYPGSVFNGVTSTAGDPNCDPAHANALANSKLTGAIPNSPSAGTFWLTEFAMLVQNAFPAVPPTTNGGSGFTITPSGAVSVVQGATVTSSITVGVTGGFSGTIALSVTGQPSGVTATFNPASVVGAAGSTLTVTASATAVPGTYTLTATGTSGSTTETAPITLTVVSAPNFNISASPTAITLPVGTNPTDTITVGFVGGLTGSVSVSASGLPSGMQANFAPSSVNAPGGTIIANFSAQASTAPGTYPVKIVGTNGTITNSTTINITVPGTNSFTLAASVPSLSIAQGASGTNTITITDQSGFNGSVTLAASGLPTGVTATFGTNPATSSSVLTLTASSTATTGAFTVTVTGTSGSLAPVTTTFTLSVTNTGGFTLKPSSATLSIAQGASGTDTITVTDISPFAGSVSFAVSGLPSGVTASFSPASSTTSSVLTLTASSTAAAGTSTITVTGTSGTLTPVTTSIALTVTSVTGGFTLKPSASTLSIAQGASGTDTITVTDISPFAGSVTLAASGLPTGVTAAFGTNPTTGSSVLTLTASSSAAAGNSTITITGTSGTLTPVTTSIALTVTSVTGGFTLKPSAPTLSIAQGSSGTDTITVTDISPFTGSVTLAASGLPAGVTAAFGTNPTTGSSVLTLTASSTAAAGTSTITVTGTSGTLSPVTTTIALTITAPTGGCAVTYTTSPQNTSQFGATIAIKNNGTSTLSNWSLTWTFANGQTISNSWNGAVTQSGANVTVSQQAGQSWQNIPAGGTYSGFGFNGTWNGVTNAKPTAFSLNGTACTVN